MVKLIKILKVEVEDIVRYAAEYFTPQEIKQLIRELNDFLKRKLAEEE
jgi:effector-binding domain-containing protein